ncbi:hypothetical protein ScPMuIL_008759 [Solemya velum]
MSAVSTSRPRKVDPLSRKVPENPKYKHVRATVDTGASITRYMEKIEDIRKNYRFKKNDVFKRIKVNTFIQLVIQVAEYENSNNDETNSTRPDTTDLEVRRIQGDNVDLGIGVSPAPSLAMTEGDYGEPISTSRSTLQRVIKGVGEVDLDKPPPSVNNRVGEICPYLLLDLRDKDAYDQCHIITAKHYPIAMLSRSVNYESQDMLKYKNQTGLIIIVYDEDERIANAGAATLVERGYDNLFLLSGGMKVAYRIFPEGFLTGTPSPNVTENQKIIGESKMANQEKFTLEDVDKLLMYSDRSMVDRSVGSRLSQNSTLSSRMSMASSQSYKSSSGYISDRPPFKP